MLKKLLIFLLLVACNRSIIDDDMNKSRQEVYDQMTQGVKYGGKYNIMAGGIRDTSPDMSKLLVMPPPPPMGNGELITIAITEEIPIKDLLIELARTAKVDIELDPSIQGGIILKVTNKPFEIVIDRIAKLSNLRYTFTNNILRFQKDVPYTKNYDLDFLSTSAIWGSAESSIKQIIDINKPTEEMKRQKQVNELENVKVDVPKAQEPKVIVNKAAGMITIYANEKTQRAVENYIIAIKRNYSAQVLIEAKVVEVSLNKDFRMGIDWNYFSNDSMKPKSNDSTGSSSSSSSSSSSPRGSTFSLTGSGVVGSIITGSLTNAINALDSFGNTRTLSSPRIHAINNQPAEIKFVNKLVYFSIEGGSSTVSGTTGDNVTTSEPTATKQEEEVGVVLKIEPSINLSTNEVTLSVEPDLKVHVDDVADPTNQMNKVPIIESRTLKTSLKVRSGEILVIGGLMSDDTSGTDSGIPILSGIPLLGHLFKSSTRTKTVKETVIFIKATIIKPNGGVSPHDRHLYQNFTNDKDNFM
jgi:general secretion pathway protein D